MVIDNSGSMGCKGYAYIMQILEDTVKTRWNVLPEDQRQGIRHFLTNVIISVATGGEAKQRVYLQKLNLVLVQVCCTPLSEHGTPSHW
jgi:exportin-1